MSFLNAAQLSITHISADDIMLKIADILSVIVSLLPPLFAFVQSGDIEIVNHRTKETCQLKFSPYSYFSRDVPRKVNVWFSTLYFYPTSTWRHAVWS